MKGFGQEAMQQIVKSFRRRKGIISLASIDPTITAETSQPTIQGKPCLNCRSAVKYVKQLSAAIEYLRA